MMLQSFARSAILNISAAAAGLGGTLFITWVFGLTEFAYYTINFAKLSLILIGSELIPSSFTVFRLQEDEHFTSALPVFYMSFAFAGMTVAALLVYAGVFVHGSWFMPIFVFSSALQRYFDSQAQASGRVDAYFWIPAASNISRLVLLAVFSHMAVSKPDVLWASMVAGGLIGQAVMISRFPEFLDRDAYRAPLAKIQYLWKIRAEYYEYYANSLLKRARDTFLPIFCDLVIPSKTEIGRLFVFTRANEAVCGQVRVLEAFMVNRAIREDLRHARHRIFGVIGPLGHGAVAVISLLLMYRHGIRATDVVLAFVAGLFIYPYIAELFWRNDALASFSPRRVTLSLLSFLAGLVIPPAMAWALGLLSVPVLLGSYVLGQMLAALSYRLFPSALSVNVPEHRA